jgi:hypothetical protein
MRLAGLATAPFVDPLAQDSIDLAPREPATG